MTKEIAVLPLESFDGLLLALSELGYAFENEHSKEISGYSSDVNAGDRQTFASPEDARSFLVEGRGLIQLWNSEGDLALSKEGGKLLAHFDGFTQDQSTAVMAHLRSCGLAFDVDYDV